MISSEKNHEKSRLEERKDLDLENNPSLTTEQKEEIRKQEEISQEIVKDMAQ